MPRQQSELPWPNVRYNLNICLERLRKTTRTSVRITVYGEMRRITAQRICNQTAQDITISCQVRRKRRFTIKTPLPQCLTDKYSSGTDKVTAAPRVNSNSNKQLQCSLYCIIILSCQYRLSLSAASRLACGLATQPLHFMR